MIQRPRVIVIDDDASYREPIKSHLMKDFLVITASCGQEGISRMLTMHPEILVLGLPIRSCDGIQTLRTISNTRKLREISVMVLAFPPMSLEELRGRGFHVEVVLPKDRTLWKDLTPQLWDLWRRRGEKSLLDVRKRARCPEPAESEGCTDPQ